MKRLGAKKWAFALAVTGILLSVIVAGGIESTTTAQEVATTDRYNVYWGDTHCHSTYSIDVPSFRGETPDKLFIYARDVAKLDFLAVTDHAEAYQEDNWQKFQKTANEFYVPGNFVTFIGFEYTSMDSSGQGFDHSKPGGGHKHVIFRDNNVTSAPISSMTTSIEELWELLKPYEAIVIAHSPADGGLRHSADWNYVNAAMMPLVEIYSTHGSSEKTGTEEAVLGFIDDRSVESALMRWVETGNEGYKLGIVASSDDHSGHPGNVDESQVFPPHSAGLTAVLATEKTREAIYDALKSKRTYATSGPRISLSFTASYGDYSFMMGETIQAVSREEIAFHVAATGDGAPITKVQLIKNGEIFAEDTSDRLEVTDTASGRSYYRVKVYQEQSGLEMAWSSPIWVETTD
jgi:hypothetical protein